MNILIVGLGAIARKHIEVLKQKEGVNLYALRSSIDANTYDGVKNIFSLSEINDLSIDSFFITNPTAYHYRTIADILKFGKPLFIEKPVFDVVDESNNALIETIDSKEINTYVACNLRFLDCLHNIRHLIEDSRINEVNVYAGSYLPDWRPGINFRKNYSANKEMGGGVHIDLIHELDYLYWIFGEPCEVHSIFKSRSSLEINAVDYANYLWEYKDFCVNTILNYYRRDSKRTMEILTDDGTYIVDLLKNTIAKDGREIFSSAQTIADTYGEQIDFYLKNILTGKAAEFNTAKEAYKVLKLCIRN